MHTFLNALWTGHTYIVALVAHSCMAATTPREVVIQVFYTPQADFVSDEVQLTFPEVTFAFTNTSTAVADADHTWSFGDGKSAMTPNPERIRTKDGDLQRHFGGEQRHAPLWRLRQFKFWPTPTIGFSGEGSGCAPLTVSFDNASTYASQYRWEFSDGSIRTEDIPFTCSTNRASTT